MDTEGKLSAAQAEAIVDELIEQYGHGAYPKVSVEDIGDGTWRIQWRSMEIESPAMNSKQWTDWLRRRVGSMTPERLETSEG